MNWAGQLVEIKQTLAKLEEASRAGSLHEMHPLAVQLSDKAETLRVTIAVARVA